MVVDPSTRSCPDAQCHTSRLSNYCPGRLQGGARQLCHGQGLLTCVHKISQPISVASDTQNNASFLLSLPTAPSLTTQLTAQAAYEVEPASYAMALRTFKTETLTGEQAMTKLREGINREILVSGGD